MKSELENISVTSSSRRNTVDLIFLIIAINSFGLLWDKLHRQKHFHPP